MVVDKEVDYVQFLYYYLTHNGENSLVQLCVDPLHTTSNINVMASLIMSIYMTMNSYDINSGQSMIKMVHSHNHKLLSQNFDNF
jgi:hypothetical protein